MHFYNQYYMCVSGDYDTWCVTDAINSGICTCDSWNLFGSM